MTARRPDPPDDYDDPTGPASLYDPEGEPDLWFMPDPEAPAYEPPLPRADTRPLIDPDDWIRAEASAARLLAEAASELGRLDAELATFGAGATQRLALREAEALSWAAGTPIPIEEIARDQMAARASTDLEGLARARWALRRLEGQGGLTDLRAFLGLHRTDGADLPGRSRPTGDEFDASAAAFLAGMAPIESAHPITRGAYARALWPLCDLSPEGDATEAAVWAARAMAMGSEALVFVPMAQGAPARDLPRYYSAVTRAARVARTELVRLSAWGDRARMETASIKGDSPARIIRALTARPLATTADVEQATGISRDSAERMLARMAGMGLVREVTGAKRFRLWAARP